MDDVGQLCRDTVSLLTHLIETDEDVLVEVLGGDITVGALYARAVSMNLIELQAQGIALVASAHAALMAAVESLEVDGGEE